MRYAAALLVAVLGAAGCQGGDDQGGFDQYVAIGDSYTAGAGTGPMVAGAPGAACGQVRGSYPRLVASELGARLRDASCGGAQTANGTQPQVVDNGQQWPPELDALSKGTDLVTVGMGFNDFNFFGGLTFGCATVAATDPGGAPCRDADQRRGADQNASADRIGDLLRDLLTQVHHRAPSADVVLVGYPQLVPAAGTCPALPLAAGDYAYVHDQLDHLNDVMHKAADDEDATFVDVYRASQGHDICAGDDAWLNGGTPVPGARAYHPFASEQRAVAELVLAAVRD